MLGEIFGGLVDKEKIIKEYIEGTVEDTAEELKCNPDQLFIMIKPTGTNFNFKVFLYDCSQGGAPKMVREMELKEFVSNE